MTIVLPESNEAPIVAEEPATAGPRAANGASAARRRGPGPGPPPGVPDPRGPRLRGARGGRARTTRWRPGSPSTCSSPTSSCPGMSGQQLAEHARARIPGPAGRLHVRPHRRRARARRRPPRRPRLRPEAVHARLAAARGRARRWPRAAAPAPAERADRSAGPVSADPPVGRAVRATHPAVRRKAWNSEHLIASILCSGGSSIVLRLEPGRPAAHYPPAPRDSA